jgi:hypothetical protein
LNAVSNPLAQQICQTADADCKKRVVDVMFVLTSSTLVQQDSANGWSNLASFAADLISGFNVGPQLTHIGVVTFADQVQPILSLTQSFDGNTISQFVRTQGFNSNLGSGQNIQAALNYVQTQQFSTSQDRSDVPNVIILITNTASTANTLQTIATAKSIRQSGTKIFTIGSTSRINVTELQLIASEPHLQNRQWWTVADFSTSLANIQPNVANELCRPDYESYCRPTEFGGYQCFCPWGFCDTRPMNGTQCVDLNECLVNNGGCQQNCNNRVGSYACSCQSGFVLASDGKFCDDIDECQSAGTCVSGQCVNSYGTFYCVQDQSFISGGQASPQDASDGLQPATRQVIYSPNSLIMAIVVALSITMLAIVVVALGIRHAIKLRADKDADDVSPTVATPIDGPRINTLSSWGFDSMRTETENGAALDSAPLNAESHS